MLSLVSATSAPSPARARGHRSRETETALSRVPPMPLFPHRIAAQWGSAIMASRFLFLFPSSSPPPAAAAYTPTLQPPTVNAAGRQAGQAGQADRLAERFRYTNGLGRIFWRGRSWVGKGSWLLAPFAFVPDGISMATRARKIFQRKREKGTTATDACRKTQSFSRLRFLLFISLHFH